MPADVIAWSKGRALAAVADGVAAKRWDNPVQAVRDAMWQQVYPEGQTS